MATEQKETFTAENDALLVEKKPEPKDAKRNSKQELIQRILDLVKKNNIEIDYSDSKLKRMTKTQLQEVLGTVMEKIMQSQMAEQLGCDRSATDQVMAMAALRMIHDIAANGFESGANFVAHDTATPATASQRPLKSLSFRTLPPGDCAGLPLRAARAGLGGSAEHLRQTEAKTNRN